MNSKKYVFIKEEEVVPSNIQIPREFIDRGKNCFVGIYSDYRYNPYQYNDEAEVNKLELAEYLVHDYLEYGLYGLYHNSFVKDGTGINDWNRTVEAEMPVINEESILYDPILGRKSL